jgi:hypothetical protein
MKQDKTSALQTQRSEAFSAILYISLTFWCKYQLSITTNQSTLRNITEKRISQTLYLVARWGVCTAPRLDRLTPMERDSNHCTGGWVGHTAGLDGCGKPRPHRDSIPETSVP